MVTLAFKFISNSQKEYTLTSGGRELTGTWFAFSNDITMTIINMLDQKHTDFATFRTDWENSISKSGVKRVQVRKIVLPAKLETFVFSLTAFPRVSEPKKMDWEELISKVKPLFQGSFEITLSEGVLKTFNLLQRKKFKINAVYLQMLQDFYGVDITKPDLYKALMALDYDLPSKETIIDLKEKLLDFKLLETSNVLHMLTYQTNRDHIKGLNLGLNFFQPIRQIAGYLPVEAHLDKSLLFTEQDLRNKSLRSRYARTCLAMSEILLGLELYFTNIFCVRLRFYPGQPILSRTSGILKHLIQDHTAQKLTNGGLIELLRAYYFKDAVLLAKFESFVCTMQLSNKKTFFRDFDIFFSANPLNFSKVKSAPYFMLLHTEILNCFITKKTATPIEIDQKASGITLLALLVRNKPLAEQCNIINMENRDVYVYCSEQFEEFYNAEIKRKDPKVLNFFLRNRKNMKYAFMCFAYRQKTLGRFKDVYLEHWVSEFGTDPTFEERQALFEVAAKFEPFLESLFPGLTHQIKRLEAIIEFVVDLNSKVQITTLDGVKLSWDFFEVTSQIRNAFNPHTQKSQSYHIHRAVAQSVPVDATGAENPTDDGATKLVVQRDKSKHARCFLSYFVHSLDAAIIRIIAAKLFDRTGYICNTLHDCILLHPNYVGVLYQIIKEVYSEEKMYNLAQDLIFTQLRSQISEEYYPEFDLLVGDFFAHCYEFESEIGNFDPRNLFQPE
jgi:hypothetical protein